MMVWQSLLLNNKSRHHWQFKRINVFFTDLDINQILMPNDYDFDLF
jgi:hypothetical protein